MNPQEDNTVELYKRCIEVAEDRKADNLRVYDVSASSILADFYMICTGNSEPHLKAVANTIEKTIKDEFGIFPRNVDGRPNSHWVILDYGNLLIHVQHPDSRSTYRLEDLWKEGTQIYPELTAEEIELSTIGEAPVTSED